jgi:hypothetical protein
VATTTKTSSTPAAAASIDEDALVAKITAAVLAASAATVAAPPSTVAGVADVVEFGEPEVPWTVGATVTQPTEGRPRYGVVVAVDAYGNPQVAWYHTVTDPIHRGDPSLTRV